MTKTARDVIHATITNLHGEDDMIPIATECLLKALDTAGFVIVPKTDKLPPGYKLEALTSAWQPIETAPKDGTRVLVCVPRPPAKAIRVMGIETKHPGEDWVAATTGVFTAHFQDGYWSVGNAESLDERFIIEPDKWMPLPSRPA